MAEAQHTDTVCKYMTSRPSNNVILIENVSGRRGASTHPSALACGVDCRLLHPSDTTPARCRAAAPANTTEGLTTFRTNDGWTCPRSGAVSS